MIKFKMLSTKSEVKNLNGYQELSKLIIFSISEVEVITENKKTAYSLIYRLMNKGLVKKIRNNMYTCVNPITDKVLADKLQIACASSRSAYISHYSALEYHGLTHVQSTEVHVSSASRFRDYEFEGLKFKYISSSSNLGVIQQKEMIKTRVTNIEKTVIDVIKDFERFGELRILLETVSLIEELDPNKMITYLDDYKIQSLYQKTGFVLEYFLKKSKLPDVFYDYCVQRLGKSTRYLNTEAKDDGEYINKWKLVIPKYILENNNNNMWFNVNLR